MTQAVFRGPRLVAALILLATAAAPAAAQASPDLSAAIRAGQVGERYDGYLGYAATPPVAVQRQVAAINIRRRSLYTDLGGRRGVGPQEVGIATGCELLARVQVGQAYLLPDNVWRRRPAGQPPALPAYCR